MEGFGYGVEGRAAVGYLDEFDELYENFCVGVAFKGVSVLDKGFFQYAVVFDCAVMNKGYRAGLGELRVCVDVVRFSVRCPSGVGYAYGSVCVFSISRLFQVAYFASGLVDVEVAVGVDERHTCTVVAAVLQTVKPLDKDFISLSVA